MMETPYYNDNSNIQHNLATKNDFCSNNHPTEPICILTKNYSLQDFDKEFNIETLKNAIKDACPLYIPLVLFL